MVAHVQKGGQRLVPFEQIEPKLRKALLAFGPIRKSTHPEYPFWHLQSDNIWEVQSEGEVILRQQSANPTAKQLRLKKAAGGFLQNDFAVLKASPALQTDVIHDILDTHFPTSIHEDIVDFFGLLMRSKDNEPHKSSVNFRREVLSAYGDVCAVSNFSVRMDDTVFGVEPAHLLWPQAGGQSVVNNAIAMTPLHRKLFHLGVFTIDSNCRVRISKFSKGSNGFSDLLGQFEGKKISLPGDTKAHPDQDALQWHREEVFRH